MNIDLDLDPKFKFKMEKQEHLRRLKDEYDFTYVDEAVDNKYLWEAAEIYDYLTYFPSYLSYPTEALDSYYLRYYWIVVQSKRFEKVTGYDLDELEWKVLEEYEWQQPTPDEDLLEKLHDEAIRRVQNERL
jgi:hypothetical protein